MELKDLHYRSVLSTRKDAVCGLDIKIEPAGEDAIYIRNKFRR
ncbi:MAG: phage portal protein family protein [Treponemataceae bacterium]